MQSTIGHFALALSRENEVEYLMGLEKWLKDNWKGASVLILQPLIYQANYQFEDAIEGYDEARRDEGGEGHLFINRRIQECMAAMGVWDWWKQLPIEDEHTSNEEEADKDGSENNSNSLSKLRAYWDSYSSKFEGLELGLDHSASGNCFLFCEVPLLPSPQFQISFHQMLSSPSRLGSLMWALSASGLSSKVSQVGSYQSDIPKRQVDWTEESSVCQNNIGYISCLKVCRSNIGGRNHSFM